MLHILSHNNSYPYTAKQCRDKINMTRKKNQIEKSPRDITAAIVSIFNGEVMTGSYEQYSFFEKEMI